MAAKFEGSKAYNLDKIQLMKRAKTALEQCKFEIKFIDENSGKIHAKSKFSIWSFAEDIDIKVEEHGRVTMKSECTLPTQVIDWGKNKKNVKKFFEALG